MTYSRFSRYVTAAMLVYRTIAKIVFWDFDSIIVQNFSGILPLFCTPAWPSHHVSENQEFKVLLVPSVRLGTLWCVLLYTRKWFEPRSYIPRWTLIVRVEGLQRRTVDSDWRFKILSGGHYHSRCTCHPSPSSLSFILFFHLPITIQTRASLHSFEIPTVTLLLAGYLNASQDQKCFSGLLSKGRRLTL